MPARRPQRHRQQPERQRQQLQDADTIVQEHPRKVAGIIETKRFVLRDANAQALRCGIAATYPSKGFEPMLAKRIDALATKEVVNNFQASGLVR